MKYCRLLVLIMTAHDFIHRGVQIVNICENNHAEKWLIHFEVLVHTWVGFLPELSGALETLSTFNSSEHRYFPRRLSETIA